MRISTSGSTGLNNIYKRFLITAIISAIVIISGSGEQIQICNAGEPVENIKITLNDTDTLHRHIKSIIIELEYPDAPAGDFIKMVDDWTDKQGRPIFVYSSKKLADSQDACKKGQITSIQLAKLEEGVILELGRCLPKKQRKNPPNYP